MKMLVTPACRVRFWVFVRLTANTACKGPVYQDMYVNALRLVSFLCVFGTKHVCFDTSDEPIKQKSPSSNIVTGLPA